MGAKSALESTADINANPDGQSGQARTYFPFAVIVLTFSAISLWLAAKLSLYIDELYSLDTTSHGLSYALHQSLGFEQQPPLFFLALTLWRAINASDYFARLFSIGCCIGTLFVVWVFARRRLQPLPDWLVPLVFAVNPFFIWAALDIRVYAMIVLLSAILITLYFDAFVDDAAPLRRVLGFTLVAIAAIYTQYFLGFMLIGFCLALTCSRQWRKVVLFSISMLVVALAIAPLVLGSVSHELQDASVVHIRSPLVLSERMLSSTLSFVFPHMWVSATSTVLNFLYVPIVFLTFIALVRANRPNVNLLSLVSIVAAMIALFLLVINAARAPLEMPRHITALFVPTMLLMLGWLAAVVTDGTRRRISLWYVVVLLLLSAGDDTKTYRQPLSNIGDWQRVGAFLNGNVKASEPIAVFDTEDALAVRHYYRGSARIVPIPHEQDFTKFDRRDFAIRSSSELASVFPHPSLTTGQAWLVVGVTTCSMIEVGESCSLLNTYVKEHFRVLSEREFNGAVVRQLQAVHVSLIVR